METLKELKCSVQARVSCEVRKLAGQILQNLSHSIKKCLHHKTKSHSLQFLSSQTYYKHDLLKLPETDLTGITWSKASERANQIKVLKMVNHRVKSISAKHLAHPQKRVKVGSFPMVNHQ